MQNNTIKLSQFINTLFNQDAKKPFYYRLILHQRDIESSNLFHILLEILFNGLIRLSSKLGIEIINDVNKNNNNNNNLDLDSNLDSDYWTFDPFTKINLDYLPLSIIEKLQEYFISFGFTIKWSKNITPNEFNYSIDQTHFPNLILNLSKNLKSCKALLKTTDNIYVVQFDHYIGNSTCR